MITKPNTSFDCAAIIGTKDRPRELAACLASLAALRPPLREVIVVDQGSGAPAAPPAGLSVTVLRPERSGLSYARNQGLMRANALWAFFPDDDCTVAQDALERAAEALHMFSRAAFLCGRVLPPEAAKSEKSDNSPRALTTPEEVLRVGLSAGLFVKRDLLERLHGFDERFGVGGRYPSGEESELLFRALDQGARGVYAPAIQIFHADPFTVLEPAAQQRRAFDYGRGWGALFAKHAAWASGKAFQRLQRHYLMRALGGAALAILTLRPALAHRYIASFRGRRLGWKQWCLQERLGP